MYPCVIPGCAAMAEKDGGECAPHRAGYRLANGSRDLRCAQCRHLITGGQWYRRVGEHIQHVRACTVHPDVVKERKAQEERVSQ